MTKILLFSDAHIHPHKKSEKRLDDCLDALIWVFETAKKNNIKNILFGGDFFHDRSKIESLVLHKTFNILKKYLDGSINFYILLGNHDLLYFEKTTISSVTAISGLPNVHIISSPKRIMIDDISWHFIPFTHNPTDDLNYLSQYDPKNSYLLGHLAIDGARLNSKGSIADIEIEHDGEMVKVNANIFRDYKHVYLGHYHNAQMIDSNVEYIGSPLQLSFGEMEEVKNIIILEFDGEDCISTYVSNNFSPQHFEDTFENLQKIDPRVLKNSYVSVLVDNVDKKEISDKVKCLEEKGISFVKIKKNTTAKDDSNEKEQIILAKEILCQSDKMVQKFVEMSETSLDKDILVKFGMDVINQAQE